MGEDEHEEIDLTSSLNFNVLHGLKKFVQIIK